ncbi:unnamed protein product [Arabidopsis lyrata]|uniref:uncharacterized protein LOC9318502 isoform X1 n=2 Tax=Arabidopsis lyrata subsp. lyrata TaxID=81972 RepID=UPI000A29CB5C|nr:uncharacterized protein LOC9318502 isoform X1 [Arabidopsis lyrata subsp. lyrata]CAH8259494.1 unnamed protein product [Arabidopsis lyrata]|eukprot:XP_020886133.1 uncharacterized protein LOC9318502 isoform X1 [Arabidopsis lyrata subsp. lyrata]
MKRSREESQGGRNNNRFVDEVSRLRLPLTKGPELINKIENYLNRNNTCPHQQTENSKTSTFLKSSEKLKAMNFPISMIEIGTWTPVAINPDDIVAKFYFAKKKLIWEFLFGEPDTNMPRLKRKIEIQWNDISSFEERIYTRDETGILKIELRKRPTFFIETNPQAGKHTQWKQLDDFTDNQASTCRRHTIHFPPGVLQKNLEKLLTDSFWSKLYNVPFPVEESLFFDMGFENNNSSRNSHNQTVSFNVNYGLQHHHYSQGIGGVGVGVGDRNFNIAPQFRANGGWQRNSYSQANSLNYNTANELPRMQAIITPSFQVVNEHHNMQMDFTGSQYINQMNQDEIRKMQIIREIAESQAYAAVPDTQTNNVPMYPPVGSHVATLIEEEERQYKDQKIPYIRSSNWEVLPGMDTEEDW